MISVIISAHNRKEYLLEAIKSVVNQTLDPKNYEIIVVKNFKDETVDEYISAKGIFSIFTNETTYSRKLLEGLHVSKGDIISFLDDDDIFFGNKLEMIYNEFLKSDCVFIHNNIQAINDKGDLLIFKDNRICFNMSSITVKKKIIKTEILKMSPFNLDTVMYAFALESEGKITDLKDVLTYYRVHDSITHAFTNFEDYKVFYTNSIERSLKAYSDIYPLFRNKNARNLLLHEMIFLNIRLKIFAGKKVALNEYIKFIFIEHQVKVTSYEYKLLIGSIFFRKSIVKKLHKNELLKRNKVMEKDQA